MISWNSLSVIRAKFITRNSFYLYVIFSALSANFALLCTYKSIAKLGKKITK